MGDGLSRILSSSSSLSHCFSSQQDIHHTEPYNNRPKLKKKQLPWLVAMFLWRRTDMEQEAGGGGGQRGGDEAEEEDEEEEGKQRARVGWGE